MEAARAPAIPEVTERLGAKVVRGVGWKLASQIADQGSRLVMTVVLARLLTPSEYGIAGMALVFTGIAFVFTDLSLGAALVQRRQITERDRSTVFWTTATAGVLCTLVGILFAPLVADFFSEPEVAPLFAVVSITFTLTALSATQASLLTREMAFRGLELREIAAGLARAVVAIAVAFAGFGPWAIVWGSVAAAVASLVMLWTASPWRPSFVYSLRSLRELGPFSVKMFASRQLAYFTSNADSLLIGRFLGAASLGIYTLAYNVMFAPLGRITQPVSEVLFPALSRIQDNLGRVAQAWLRASTMCATIAFPALAGMILVAPDFVPLVLGDQWRDAIPVVQLLCVAGLCVCLQPLNYSLLQARGRAGTLLRFNALDAVASVAAFLIGLRWGVVGVAACFAASRVLLLPVNTWLACRAVSVSPLEYVRALRTVLEASVAMTTAVAVTRELLLDQAIAPAARLVILIAVGAASFAAVVLWRDRELVSELRRLRA